MKRVFLMVLPLILLSGYIRGQSITPFTINSAGGTAKIGTNTYEWSVAEMAVVQTATGSNIIVTQGILQPMPQNATGIQDPVALYQNLQVYPNPTSGTIYLQYNLPSNGTIRYSLQDVTGKQILSNRVAVSENTGRLQIEMASVANANYMLSVYYQPLNGTAQAAAYKINKIN
jgi:hypothetical protein